MVINVPCTLVVDFDDSVLSARLVEVRLAKLADVPPRIPRAAHLIPANQAKAEAKRRDVEALKPRILDLLARGPSSVHGIVDCHGAFSKMATREALKQLRLSGEVVIDACGLCVLAPAGLKRDA